MSDMSSQTAVLVRMEGPIAVVTLNRQPALNAFNDEMRGAFIEVLDRLGRDPSISAMVLTGAGKAFCSGGDVAAMKERLQVPTGEVAGNGWRRQRRTHHATSALFNFEKPTIAAVNGPAVGLGCDLALCCDFNLASEAAMFQMSYILRGLIPDGGSLYLLPRRVGMSRAKDLIFSGRRVYASEALALGLADRLSSPEDLIAEAISWAGDISQGSATARALGKSILNRAFELSIDEIFAQGSLAQAICYTTSEHRESVEAFLTKKPTS